MQVCFLPSFTDAERGALLAACRAVVYSPQNEHFGIVPLEAMASARPVIACNSGGPLESIRDGVTGFLVEPNPDAFAAAMLSLMVSPLIFGLKLAFFHKACISLEQCFARYALDFCQASFLCAPCSAPCVLFPRMVA